MLPCLRRTFVRRTFAASRMSSKMSQYSAADAKVLSTEDMPPNEAKWIKLIKINWKDPTGKGRVWESAVRQTRPKGGTLDAVGIVAILKTASGPSLLLQKQFRPAVDAITIEVPSGLVDEGESPTQSAIRELKEETGYVATLPADKSEADAEGFVMWNDPGFCNTNTKMVFLEVDLEREENKVPKPELEEGEFIETLTIPLDTLWEELGRLDREGFAIDARVGTLAQGLEVARLWKRF